MNLNLKGFSQLVEDMGAALQSSASSLVDVSIGSVVRAIFEANASVVLWLQWLILQVLASTRASTSSGPDLDSWMLDFGLTRLPAVPSTGIATFSRFVDTLSATIPTGTLVKTTDGSLIFSVTEDQTLSIWQSSASAYVLPGGVGSANLPVVCTTSGSVGNVLSGTITVIAASLPGVDQVNNANPLSDGADAESDQAFRNRFQSYLASRSRATLTAVRNAIASVQQGLNVAIEENTAPSGTTQIGSFLVIVDDGSGYPPSALLSTVSTAVDSVRPIGTTFAVVPPQVVIVNVSLTAVLNSAGTASLIVPSIQNYVAVYLNSLSIGTGASVTRVAQNAYLAGFGVENITGVQLNGGSSDFVALPGSVIKAGQIVVTTNDG
jgi:phage-related baseplate assembly protein